MPKSPHPITIDDSVNLKLANDAQISPDAKFVAFTVDYRFRIDTKHPNSQIWLADTVGQIANLSHRPFTTGSRTDNIPRWSLDSSTLAFLSNRMNFVSRVKTPPLILVGEIDPFVPINQG